MSEIRTIVAQKGVETVIPPCPYQRENFTFVGWNTDRNASTAQFPKDQDGNTKVTLDEDTTLYAIWEKTTFGVVFDPNQGDADIEDAYMEAGQPLGELPGATRLDYDFTGWFTQGGTKVSSDTIVNHDMTLFAQWQQRTSPTPEPPAPEPGPEPEPGPPEPDRPPAVLFDTNDLTPLGRSIDVYCKWYCPQGCGLCYAVGNTTKRCNPMNTHRNDGALYRHKTFTDTTYVRVKILPARNMTSGNQTRVYPTSPNPPVFEYPGHDHLCWYLMQETKPHGMSQESGAVEINLSNNITAIKNSKKSDSKWDFSEKTVYVNYTDFRQKILYPGMASKVWGFCFWALIKPIK